MIYKFFLFLSISILLSSALSADNADIDSKYYHMHEGNEHVHDLTLAMINFKTDKITDLELQLLGRWELEAFQTTDHEMDELVRSSSFKIWYNVYEDYMQVTVVANSSNKEYKDPPVPFTIVDGDIVVENGDFNAGLSGEFLVFTMLGMDEAYRYTFKR